MADSNVLPLYLRFTALSTNWQGTPQELADAIAEGLEILSDQQFALFQRGASEPASDIGPWMDTSSTVGMWKAFDYITGRYVPMALDPLSLKYILQTAQPDSTKFDVWFVLNDSGKGTGVDIYYDGAWHDIYEDQFSAVNTSIAAINTSLADYAKSTDVTNEINTAIAALPSAGLDAERNAFTAIKTADQLFAANNTGGSFSVVWESTEYDTASAFSSNKYLCKTKGIYLLSAVLAIELLSGTFTNTSYYIAIRVNGGSRGGVTIYQNGPGADDGNQRTYFHKIQTQLNVGDEVDVYVTAFNDTSADGRIIGNGLNRFEGFLIQQQS